MNSTPRPATAPSWFALRLSRHPAAVVPPRAGPGPSPHTRRETIRRDGGEKEKERGGYREKGGKRDTSGQIGEIERDKKKGKSVDFINKDNVWRLSYTTNFTLHRLFTFPYFYAFFYFKFSICGFSPSLLPVHQVWTNPSPAQQPASTHSGRKYLK